MVNQEPDFGQTVHPSESPKPSVKPNIPQWGTLIWGIIWTVVAALTLWWLLTGQWEWWSFLSLLGETERVIVPLVTVGGLLVLFGILATTRRNR